VRKGVLCYILTAQTTFVWKGGELSIINVSTDAEILWRRFEMCRNKKCCAHTGYFIAWRLSKITDVTSLPIYISCLKLIYTGYAGRFMISVITNIYNKKTKGPTLIVHSHRKSEKFFTTRDVRCLHHGWHGTHRYDIQVIATHASKWVHRYSSLLHWSVPLVQRGHVAMLTVLCTHEPMLTRVWQVLEYRIDVCRVTRGAHIVHL
jgi:hypothetical protein